MNAPDQADLARGTAIRLQALFDERGVNASTFSYDVRVNPGLVSRWLKGETMMGARYIVAVCRYFNVSADWLLGLSDDRSSASRPRTADEVVAMADELVSLEQRSERSTSRRRR